MREDADLPVRQNQPADQVMLQIAFDRAPERLLHQAAPGFTSRIALIEATTEFFLRLQRLQHRVPNLLGENTSQGIKALQSVELRVAACQINDRLTTYLVRNIAQEEAAMLTLLCIRRVGSDLAPAQLELQLEIQNDLLWE